MYKFWLLSLICLLSFTLLSGHEGHHEKKSNEVLAEGVHPTIDETTINTTTGSLQKWTQWLGSFHLVFLHFPIALIIMTAFSEFLFVRYPRAIFDHAARFMLISAAIFGLPTAFLGLIYSYSVIYEGLLADMIWWHMWFGIATAVFAIVVAYILEYEGRGKLYYVCLLLLFLLVSTTASIGGEMTFGDELNF